MKTLRIILFFASIVFFNSCETFDWFQTDSGLNEKIQGTWQREFLGDTSKDYIEDWKFKDGKIVITHQKNNTVDTIDYGNYSMDAKINVSYLKIDGLTVDSTVIQYNNKWTITQLDSKILYLATDYKTGGVLQREFEKK
ncbi:MAG: hypothetical protein ABIT08_06080 [Bacteroidia bacterium]